MAKTKQKHRGKRPGETYADVLARKRALKEGIREAARDATVRLEADTQTQRALWLATCSIADAYGFGPKNMEKFFAALQKNTDELERMREEVDEDYAYEKLRQKAERVTGISIQYLYEQERIAAEIRHAKEGVELEG